MNTERHKIGIKWYGCIPCNFVTDMENLLTKHEFRNKHRAMMEDEDVKINIRVSKILTMEI